MFCKKIFNYTFIWTNSSVSSKLRSEQNDKVEHIHLPYDLVVFGGRTSEKDVETILFLKEKNKSVDIDFLTSICTFTDRKNFFVQLQENGKADFLLSGLTRKGQDCEQHYMIDGSLYLIKTSFLERVIQSENTNETFWNGKFQVIINDAPFIDIDTFQDMERFKYILKVSPL